MLAEDVSTRHVSALRYFHPAPLGFLCHLPPFYLLMRQTQEPLRLGIHLLTRERGSAQPRYFQGLCLLLYCKVEVQVYVMALISLISLGALLVVCIRPFCLGLCVMAELSQSVSSRAATRAAT